MTSQLYTWDLSFLKGLCGNPSAENGGQKVRESAPTPAPLPTWTEGLMKRETVEIPDPASWDTSPRTFEHSHKYTDKGRAWVQAALSNLDERFPHEGEYGQGFFVYTHPGRCLITLYDPGFDMPQEWRNIFGKTAPMFTDCHRLPSGWRPWKTGGSTAPTVFYDGFREDWHLTDSLGAPYCANALVQVRIDWLYTLQGVEDRQELIGQILPELGAAAKAWECRVQPQVGTPFRG